MRFGSGSGKWIVVGALRHGTGGRCPPGTPWECLSGVAAGSGHAGVSGAARPFPSLRGQAAHVLLSCNAKTESGKWSALRAMDQGTLSPLEPPGSDLPAVMGVQGNRGYRGQRARFQACVSRQPTFHFRGTTSLSDYARPSGSARFSPWAFTHTRLTVVVNTASLPGWSARSTVTA